MNEDVSGKREIVLVDLLDRILYKGVIIIGDITISVANVDLVYLGLKVMLTSIDKAEEMRAHANRDLMAIMASPGTRKEVKP